MTLLLMTAAFYRISDKDTINYFVKLSQIDHHSLSLSLLFARVAIIIISVKKRIMRLRIVRSRDVENDEFGEREERERVAKDK